MGEEVEAMVRKFARSVSKGFGKGLGKGHSLDSSHLEQLNRLIDRDDHTGENQWADLGADLGAVKI